MQQTIEKDRFINLLDFSTAQTEEEKAIEAKAAADAAPVVEEKTYGEPDPVEPIKTEMVSIDDFGKLDLRVCKIVKCQEIRKSHSCYKLTLNDGIDERVIEEIVDEEISIGDYVLTGGELPALVLADSISRMLPGVLPNEEAFSDESHYSSLLEHPQYTRPYEWHGQTVPDILLSGHHANICKWKREQSLMRTYLRRPDMLAKADLDKKDIEFLRQFKAQLKDAQKNDKYCVF